METINNYWLLDVKANPNTMSNSGIPSNFEDGSLMMRLFVLGNEVGFLDSQVHHLPT